LGDFYTNSSGRPGHETADSPPSIFLFFAAASASPSSAASVGWRLSCVAEDERPQEEVVSFPEGQESTFFAIFFASGEQRAFTLRPGPAVVSDLDTQLRGGLTG
jgi:hypothetical protein